MPFGQVAFVGASRLFRYFGLSRYKSVEEMRKMTKEAETKSGKREVGGEMERIAVDRKRACFEPFSCVSGNVSEKKVVEESESDCWCLCSSFCFYF